MKIHQNQNIKYCTFETFDQFNDLKHGIFMRYGGYSPRPWKSLNLSTTVGDSCENVIANRNAILNILNLRADSYFDVWQVHSSDVVTAIKPRSRDETYLKADAIITNSRNVSLLMRFADCVPIFLFDPIQNVIGLVHAGWIGTLNLIAQKSVLEMQNKFNCMPHDIMSGIGPSICPEHYQVGEEVIEKAKLAFPQNWDLLINGENDKYFLDLRKANSISLRNAGVKQIEMSEICTACHTDDWFSHRGERGRTGRFGAMIALTC